MAALSRRLFQPLWAWWDGDLARLRDRGRFDYVDRLDPEEVERRQWEGVRAILAEAGTNTRYYAELFRTAGLAPAEVDGPSALRRLPPLTKEIIRERFDDLRSSALPDDEVLEASTGGSTGVAMRFLRDRRCVRLRRAQEAYFDRWLDYRLGDKVALFVSVSHYVNTTDRFKARVRNATLERMLSFDPHENDERYLAEFAEKFRRFDPSLVKCFPNSLAVFADYLRQSGTRVPPVRSIACAGENLYRGQRELFREVFGGEVFEKYGTRDAGVIACECPAHDGLHLFTEGAYVEVIREDGSPAEAGESGRVLVTDLFNRAMPLIRYEIGDMAVVGRRSGCSCGSTLPMLERILGRDRDIVIDSNGRPRVGYLFVEVVKDLDLEAQFQIVQPDRERLIVRVADPRPSDAVLEQVREKFQEIVGPRVTLEFDFVDAITRDPSGKYRYVVSELTRWRE